MTKAMREADVKANAGDYDGVKQLLTSQINKMKACKEIVSKYHGDAALEEEYDAMADDLEECKMNSETSSMRNKKRKKERNMQKTVKS